MPGSAHSRLLAALTGVCACALSLIAQPAAAETLVLSSWLPPRHAIVVNAIKPWADQVEEATEGRVTIRLLAKPLGPPPAHYDMARDGVADITYGLHSFTTDDRFVRSRIGQFSFLGDDAVAASKAFWQVYGSTLEAQKEHEGVKLLALFMHGPGVLHTAERQIQGPDDFAGLKIRTPGGYISDLMTGLGATTQFMSSPEVYEKLSRGVIDGVTFTYEAVTAFKLTDYVKHTMSVPGGMYNTTWFVVMNQAKWDALSDADKAAIEALSGEAFAEMVGKAWNDADVAALEVMNDAGIQIAPAPSAVVEQVKTLAADLEAQWSEAIAGDGYDGKAALAEFRELTGVTY